MKDAITAAAGKYTETSFSIGNVQFAIEKLLPMEAFAVLEEIREAVGGRISESSDKTSTQALIASVLLSIPPTAVKSVMVKVFAGVEYKNESTDRFLPLAPAGKIDDSGLEGLEGINIYELLARALAVNFFLSFGGVMSLLGEIDQDSPQSQLKI